MNGKITRVNIGCGACALLIALVLALQFVPFWQHEAGSASINAYVWLPSQNAETTALLQGALGEDFTVGNMVGGPAAELLCGIIALVLCIFCQKSIFAPLMAAVTGAVGAVAYLATPALQLGSLWGLHLATCLLLAAMGAVTTWWKKNTL